MDDARIAAVLRRCKAALAKAEASRAAVALLPIKVLHDLEVLAGLNTSFDGWLKMKPEYHNAYPAELDGLRHVLSLASRNCGVTP